MGAHHRRVGCTAIVAAATVGLGACDRAPGLAGAPERSPTAAETSLDAPDSATASSPVGPARYDRSRVPHRVGRWAREPALARYFAEAEEHRVQLLVRVVPSRGEDISETHRFRVDDEYVYPASAIKTFASVAALRLVESQAGVDARTPMARCLPDEETRIVRCRPWRDSSDIETGVLTVRHAIRRMQLVSDNRAFRTLYDLVGHERLHRHLWSLGFSTLRLQHRMGEHAIRSRHSPRVELWPVERQPFTIPARLSTLELAPLTVPGMALGRYHLDARGEVHEGPMSFAKKNAVGLEDLQALMVALIRPDQAGSLGVEDLGLSREDRADLLQAMTIDPGTSKNPRYLRHQQSVLHHKPLLPGLLKHLGKRHLRYVNKSGRAYGFHVENAYVEDQRSGRGLFVTATIYANPNGIVNDDDYGYARTTVPFYEALGGVLGALLIDEDP